MRNHPFSLDRADLVLISASQSGTMATEVATKVLDRKRVLTLFSSANAPPDTQVICDIRYHDSDNADGYAAAREVSDTSKTRPIRLISEHFIVEPEPPRAVVPVKTDPPKVVGEVLAQLVGEKVLVALKQTDIADERISVWIDMRALRKLAIFEQWVDRMVNQFVPATTRALVQLDSDEQSRVLADAIASAIKRQGGELSGVRMLTLPELEEGKMDWADPKSPVVVTGATAGRGTQLLAASRALRRFAPHSHRIFIAPGTIAMSSRSIDLLRRNLQQPSYRFETMFELVIDRETATESWRSERVLLEDLERGESSEAGSRDG